MKRYRNAALLVSCLFGASHAHATNGGSADVQNEVSNRSVNWNWNHNANRNYNRNTNQLTNRSSNSQHQGQSQEQSQSVRNSGNSSSRSSGVGYGGQGGRGGQGGHGGSVHSSGNNTGNSSATLSSTNSATTSGNQTTVNGDTTNYAAPPRAPVSTAIAPSLVSGADTCMGSTSLGAQGVGLGVSFGKTWTDDNCVMLKNSTLLWNMGKPDAAIALLCSNPQLRKAIEQSGSECPDGRKPVAAAIQSSPAVAPAPQPSAATVAPAFDEPEPMISARNRRDKG